MAIVFFGMRKLSFHVWKPSGEKKFGFNECFEWINRLVPNKLFSPLSHFSSQFHTWKKKSSECLFHLAWHMQTYTFLLKFSIGFSHTKYKIKSWKKKKIHIIFCFFQEEIFVLKTFFSLGLKEIFFPPLPNQILIKKMFTLTLFTSRSFMTGFTYREKQPFTPTITPTDNLELLISLTFACLWVLGTWSTGENPRRHGENNSAEKGPACSQTRVLLALMLTRQEGANQCAGVDGNIH